MGKKPTYQEQEDRIKALEEIVEECRRCEAALSEKEESYRTLQENVPVGLFRFSATGRLLSSNPAALKMFGYDVDEDLSGSHLVDYFKVPETGQEMLKRTIAIGNITDYEVELKRKDGSFFWGSTSAILIRNQDEDHGFIDGFVQDITDRKRTEVRLSREKALSDAVINSMPGVFYMYDENRRLILWNKNHEIVTGYQAEETFGKAPSDWFEGEHKRRISAAVDQAFTEGYINIEAPYRLKEGTEVPYLFNGHRLETDEGTYLLGLGLNVSNLKKSQEELLDSKRLLSDIIDFLPDAAYVIDFEGKVIVWNRAIEKLSGVKAEDMIGKDNYECAIPFYKIRRPMLIDMVLNWDDKVAQTYSYVDTQDGILFSETVNPPFRPEPSLFWNSACALYNTHGDIIGAIEVIRDISYRIRSEKEKRELEKQLRQTQKMEAIGTLAGGIAHDFNNILSAILGFTEISIRDVPHGSKLEDNLKRVFDAGIRAKDLVKQILTFSRQSDREMKPVQIKLIVKEALKLIRASIPTNIEIHQEIGSDSPIMADPTQVHQIIMNLCTNAAHAMQDTIGRMVVSLRDVELGADVTDLYPDMPPGPFVELTVSDSGHGMTPEIKDRIFDPFYTTKKRGKGTGLGLSVVHGVVKDCGGMVTVESTPGKGSTFRVYFPVIESEQGTENVRRRPLPSGNERILFVDDEEYQIELGKQILEFLGYSVTTRTSSQKALEVFRANPDAFDLVISDMAMPMITGDIFAKEIMAIRSDVPVILCTGYSEKMTPAKAKALGIKEIIMKPAVVEEMAKTVRRVLDQTKKL